MLTTALALAILTSQPAASAGPVTVKRIKTFENIHAIALAGAFSGTRFAASSEDSLVRIMDAKTGKTIFTLKGHPQPADAVAFSHDGKLLATGDQSARIWIWNAQTGKKVLEYSRANAHTKGIQSLAFTPDDKFLASVANDDTIRIWSVKGGPSVKTILGKGANLYGIGFTPTGALVTGTLGEGLRIYAPKTYALKGKIKVGGGQGANDVAVNSDGTLAATANRDGQVCVWNLKTLKKVAKAAQHMDWVVKVRFSPNGKLVASSSNDSTVLLAHPKAAGTVASFNGEFPLGSALAFTGDGAYLMTVGAAGGLQINKVTPAQGGKAVKAKKGRHHRRG